MNRTAEELEKEAQISLFAKLATEQGVDLSTMPEDAIGELWFNVYGTKLAGDMPPGEAAEEDEEKKKKKEEEAKEEEATKAAAALEFTRQQEKQAEAAWAHELGQTMAASFIQTLQKEAGAGALGASATDTVARVKQAQSATQTTTTQTKVAGFSAVDRLALAQVPNIAKEAGVDVDVAIARTQAVATLGSLEGQESKTASTTNLDDAVHVRALEYLEAAGYPVKWD